MNLKDVINQEYLDPIKLKSVYQSALPFPHIVMPNFINKNLLNGIVDEFPDKNLISKRSEIEIKRSSKGMKSLMPHAAYLTNYLHSEMMLEWLNCLTEIKQPLISDPYLVGGGYHESQRGDLLKVHADFNKHPQLGLDRRLNLLIYLNKNWQSEWGGSLGLYDRDIRLSQTILPEFNTAVIFATTSYTYHGFPDSIQCPENQSRRSLAYYYYSNGRSDYEQSCGVHSTLWKERAGEKFTINTPLSASEKYLNNISLRSVVKDCVPPILLKGINKLLGG